MTEQKNLIDHKVLETFATEMLAKGGLNQEDAKFCAQSIVDTNLWGIDSHGILRLPIYTKRLLSGAMNSNPDIKKINGSQLFEVLNGDNGPGYLVGKEAINRAIELAEKHSIGAVGATGSNHFGAAAIYTRMAAEKGMIAIAMSNVVPNMVVPGGSKPITGNNPIAMSVPTYGKFPFVLDISLSAVAGGKLLLASKNGEKIPFDWATDKDGKPTDDPDKGFAGFLLPMGGHKGFGLSLVVDILCGVITGGAFQHSLKGMYKYPDDPSLTGHFFIVINPLTIMSEDDMKNRMDSFYQTIKESPMWDDSKEMLMPGEIEYNTACQRRKEGIPLSSNLLEELNQIAADLQMENRLS